MKTAKKAVFGTVAASIVMLAAPVTVAHADPGDTLRGGCAFDPWPQPFLTNGHNEGVILDLSESQEAAGGPSVATVDCFVVVNGVEVPGTRVTASGDGVQENAAWITFTTTRTDGFGLCQQVTFADGSTWNSPDGNNPFCPADAGPQFPPQVVVDEIQAVYDIVNCLTGGQICTSFTVDGERARLAAQPVAAGL